MAQEEAASVNEATKKEEEEVVPEEAAVREISVGQYNVLRGSTHTPAPILALTALSLPPQLFSDSGVKVRGGGYTTIAKRYDNFAGASGVYWSQASYKIDEAMIDPDEDVRAAIEEAKIDVIRQDACGVALSLVLPSSEDPSEIEKKGKGVILITVPTMSASGKLWKELLPEYFESATPEASEEDWEAVSKIALLTYDSYMRRYVVATIFINIEDKKDGIRIWEASGTGLTLSRPPKESRALMDMNAALYNLGASWSQAYELVFGVNPKYLWMEKGVVEFDGFVSFCEKHAEEVAEEILWARDEREGRLFEHLPKIHREWLNAIREKQTARREICRRIRAGLFGVRFG